METRNLGSTELAVSRTCLGTMTFGAQADERASHAMLACALDHGLNFIDTANVYTGGESEAILGRILKGKREQVILASKVGNKLGNDPSTAGLSPATILRQVDESLRRLQTDYLDIYYLHQPDYVTPLHESLEAMDTLVQHGKVRYWGASNYASWQQCHMLWLAEKYGYRGLSVAQPMYNLLARGVEQELLPMCDQFDVATVVYNPLAGGLLTGKHAAGEKPMAGTRFDLMRNYEDRYWHHENFEAVERLAQVAAQEGRSLISLALCWLLHHTPIDCIIVGASRLEQLQENLTAAEGPELSDAAIAACNQVWAGILGVSPRYNR